MPCDQVRVQESVFRLVQSDRELGARSGGLDRGTKVGAKAVSKRNPKGMESAHQAASEPSFFKAAADAIRSANGVTVPKARARCLPCQPVSKRSDRSEGTGAALAVPAGAVPASKKAGSGKTSDEGAASGSPSNPGVGQAPSI